MVFLKTAKRLTAAFLSVLIAVIASSCGKESVSPTEAVTDASIPETTSGPEITLLPNAVPSPSSNKNWDLSILPEGFPKQPDGVYAVSTKEIPFNKKTSPYTKGHIALTLKTTDNGIYAFSNALSQAGYIGGAYFSTSAEDGTVTLLFNHSNDKYAVYLKSYVVLENDADGFNRRAVFEIVECTLGMPEYISEFFPGDTGGSTRKNGNYIGISSTGEVVYAGNSLRTNPDWYVSFTDNDGFVGVTLDEYKAYVNSLYDFGFYCSTSEENEEMGLTYYATAEPPESANAKGGINICYYPKLCRMDVLISSDFSQFVSS